MNDAQRLWWRQAQSDRDLFVKLKAAGVHECHLLHYMQMATEKLSKAYFWRSGKPPPKNHTGFVRFLKALLDRRPAELDRIARVLGFPRRADLDNWVSSVQVLAYELQNIAPESDERRARCGRLAKRFGWSAVTLFAVIAIFGNTVEAGLDTLMIGLGLLVAFVVCVVAWVVLKALSLPN